eukprot:509383-Amphidinium_carterae.1
MNQELNCVFPQEVSTRNCPPSINEAVHPTTNNTLGSFGNLAVLPQKGRGQHGMRPIHCLLFWAMSWLAKNIQASREKCQHGKRAEVQSDNTGL